MKTQKGINIYVLTCPKYSHLVSDFFERFYKYWGEEDVFVFSSCDTWSNGVMKLLNTIDDDIFILLHEDFFLTDYVDHETLEYLVNLMRNSLVTRISLCGNHTPERTYEHDGLFKMKDDAEYLCSFEASIFRRDELLRYMREDEDQWKAEVQTSRRMKGDGLEVLYTHAPVVHYKDKMRRGVPQEI